MQPGRGAGRTAEPLSSGDKVTFELDPEPCRRPSQETKGWRVGEAMTCEGSGLDGRDAGGAGS